MLRANNSQFRAIYLPETFVINESLKLAKGNDGLLWIAHSEGVVSYDSHSIKKYNLEYNINRTIKKLSGGDIIVFNNFQTINFSRFNTLLQRFEDIAIPSDFAKYTIYSSDVDNYNNIYLGTDRGIICYNSDSDKWFALEGFDPGKVTSLLVLDKDRIIAIIDNNISHLERKTFCIYNLVFNKLLSDGQAPLSSLYDASDERIYYGTTANEFLVYDINGRSLVTHAPIGISNVPLRDISDYDDQRLLIATDGLGIYIVNKRTLQVEQHFTYQDPYNYTIASNAIYDIYVDEQKRIFAATYANGVQVLDQKALNYKVIVPRNQSGQPVNTAINAIYEDKFNRLWLGTNNGIYKRENSKWVKFEFADGDNSRNCVILTLASQGHEMYAGGYGKGLLRVNNEALTLEPVIEYNDESNRFLFNIIPDADCGYIWLGALNTNLSRLNLSDKKIEYYGEESSILSILPSDDGLVYYCANYNAYVLDTKTDIVEKFDFDLSIDKQPKVQSIRRYGYMLYFGTTNCSLITYNTITKETKSYLSVLGEDYRNIHSIEIDNSGDVWLATTMGLVYLNLQDGIFRCYSAKGLDNVEAFVRGASHVTTDGEIVFGTLDGALFITPESKKESFPYNSLVSDPQLVDFKVDYNSIFNDTTLLTLDKPLTQKEKLELDYRDNTFSLYFTQIDYSRCQLPKFSWRLYELDSIWSEPSTLNYAEFRDVPPGSYTFELRAYSSLNNSSFSSKKIIIDVKNPWYMSNQMKVLLGVTFIILAFYFIYLAYNMHFRQKGSNETSFLVANSTKTIEEALTSDSAMDSADVFMRKVDNVLKQNISNANFNIDCLCQELCMSRSVFYGRMKQLTELTPTEMLRRIRMEYAAELIKSKKYSIQEVSEMSGFSDSKYFSKVFIKYYDCSPSKYMNTTTDTPSGYLG